MKLHTHVGKIDKNIYKCISLQKRGNNVIYKYKEDFNR